MAWIINPRGRRLDVKVNGRTVPAWVHYHPGERLFIEYEGAIFFPRRPERWKKDHLSIDGVSMEIERSGEWLSSMVARENEHHYWQMTTSQPVTLPAKTARKVARLKASTP